MQFNNPTGLISVRKCIRLLSVSSRSTFYGYLKRNPTSQGHVLFQVGVAASALRQARSHASSTGSRGNYNIKPREVLPPRSCCFSRISSCSNRSAVPSAR